MFRSRVGYDRNPNYLLHQKEITRQQALHNKKLQAIKNRKNGSGPTDTTAPNTIGMKHLNTNYKKKKMAQERNDGIRKENKMLLEKMTGIVTNLSNSKNAGKARPKSLNSISRKRELLRISKENGLIFDRLKTTQPYYHSGTWEKERDVMEGRLRRLHHRGVRLAAPVKPSRNSKRRQLQDELKDRGDNTGEMKKVLEVAISDDESSTASPCVAAQKKQQPAARMAARTAPANGRRVSSWESGWAEGVKAGEVGEVGSKSVPRPSKLSRAASTSSRRRTKRRTRKMTKSMNTDPASASGDFQTVPPESFGAFDGAEPKSDERKEAGVSWIEDDNNQDDDRSRQLTDDEISRHMQGIGYVDDEDESEDDEEATLHRSESRSRVSRQHSRSRGSSSDHGSSAAPPINKSFDLDITAMSSDFDVKEARLVPGRMSIVSKANTLQVTLQVENQTITRFIAVDARTQDLGDLAYELAKTAALVADGSGYRLEFACDGWQLSGGGMNTDVSMFMESDLRPETRGGSLDLGPKLISVGKKYALFFDPGTENGDYKDAVIRGTSNFLIQGRKDGVGAAEIIAWPVDTVILKDQSGASVASSTTDGMGDAERTLLKAGAWREAPLRRIITLSTLAMIDNAKAVVIIRNLLERLRVCVATDGSSAKLVVI